MPSASAADGHRKIKNTLKSLTQCFLLLCAFKLFANVQVRNYNEEKLQCFLSLVSKRLESNNPEHLITMESEKFMQGGENYGIFLPSSYGKNTMRIIEDGVTDQTISQKRLQNILPFYSVNKGRDGFDGGKIMFISYSADFCRDSNVRGTARRIVDPGGRGASLQILRERSASEVAEATSKSWPAQTARWATFFGTCFHFEKALNLASCISWQQRCCRATVVAFNDIKKAIFQRFFKSS